MQEVGLYWRKLKASDQWSERTQGLPDSTAIFAHKMTEPDLSSKLNYGGMGTVATGEIKHHIVERARIQVDWATGFGFAQPVTKDITYNM
jgi:hypothetical protein